MADGIKGGLNRVISYKYPHHISTLYNVDYKKKNGYPDGTGRQEPFVLDNERRKNKI